MELLKKYSTINEVLTFLKDKTGYEYSLKDIHELEIEGKIDILFYLERVRLRLEKLQPDGGIKYEFHNINLRAIYKKNFNGPVLISGGPLDYDEVVLHIDGVLRVHELLEEYYQDKSPFNPIPYDENHVYFSNFKYTDPQSEVIKHLRFDSDQVKMLINYEAKNQNVLEHLQNEIIKLEKELEEYRSMDKAESQGYLDPNNKYFSIEMKLCHDTWNYFYKNCDNPPYSHTREVDKFLKSHPDMVVNTKAIRRIATITNPKDTLAKSESIKDD